MKYIIIDKTTKARLCCDFLWRTFANFGTYNSCVKFYKSKAAAIKRAKRLNCQPMVLGLPEDLHLDAGGNCWFEEEISPGWINNIPAKLEDFVIWEK
ncbi:MAG: hypothetical protein DWQ19_08850 [Crenarchaeota archaeon]|nr:MAG: hypothetical protein DWQ19_08850 [Thermoproteota archaeon]